VSQGTFGFPKGRLTLLPGRQGAVGNPGADGPIGDTGAKGDDYPTGILAAPISVGKVVVPEVQGFWNTDKKGKQIWVEGTPGRTDYQIAIGGTTFHLYAVLDFNGYVE